MALVLTSPSCIAPNGKPKRSVVKCLLSITEEGDVAVVSRSPKPDWFHKAFEKKVKFFQIPDRRKGEIITENAGRLEREPHELLVLAGNDSDLMMAKNGGAVLVGAGWSHDEKVASTGLIVKNADEFGEVARLLDEWPGEWYWRAELDKMSVRALCDLSTYYKPRDQEQFGEAVTTLVKQSGPRLTALTALACRSFLTEDELSNQLAFGLYPSSRQHDGDTDTLSGTLHSIRTVTSKVHYAKRGQPLLVRYMNAPKRSAGGTDRNDPTEELNTLCINPAYRGKLAGRTIVLLDDCTTHGLSFSVGRSLLLAAGARHVFAIGLGKLGNRFKFTQIQLRKPADCYEARPKPFTVLGRASEAGKASQESQQELIRVFTGTD